MATIRISQLPSITGANTAVDDTVPIVDTSLNVTNKITRQEFFLNTPNIGLNTPTPDALLTVNGVASFSDGSALAPSIANSGDLNTGIFFPAEDTIAFAEGGLERMRLDANGNLGLGVTPSAWGAAFRVTQIGAATSVGTESSVASVFANNAIFDSSWKYLGSGRGATNYSPNDGQHRWFTAPSGTAGNPITFTQAMTLDANGNLGIGTASPTNFGPAYRTVHVVGTQTNTGGVFRTANSDGSAVGDFYVDASTVTLRTATNVPMTFQTNSVERYRIGTAGQFGIGGANFGTAGQAFISGGPSAPTSWGTLGLAGGGTGVTTAPAAAAVLYGFTTTATAAGVTTLTNTSSQYQLFTGTTTQTVTLPVASTLTTGWTFHIVNSSTGNLTINSSGGNLVATVIPGTTVMVTCILNSGTTAASWEYGYTDFNTLTGTGSVVMSVAPTLVTPNLGTGSFDLGAVATPSITFTGDPNTGLWSPAADTIAVSTNGSERARVYASGGVSIGNTTDPGATNLSVTGSVAASTVSTPTVTTAGTLSVSATGANIVNISTNGVVRKTYNTDGNQVFFQGAPTVIAAPATLTAAQLATGIIQYTGIAGNLTLPLGTALDTYYSANVDMAFDFSIINTSAAIVTIAVNTGVTSLGALATAASTSSRWRLRRTAANTWVIYRL